MTVLFLTYLNRLLPLKDGEVRFACTCEILSLKCFLQAECQRTG